MPEEIRSKVVDLGCFDVPYDLVWNSGFSTNAVMDNRLLWGEMKKGLHKATYDVVYKDCFGHLFPDYGDNSVIALKDFLKTRLTATATPFA